MQDSFLFYQQILDLLIVAIGKRQLISIAMIARLRTLTQTNLLKRGIGLEYPLPALSLPVKNITRILQEVSQKNVISGGKRINASERQDDEELDSKDDETDDTCLSALDYGPFSDFLLSLSVHRQRHRMWMGPGILRIAGREYIFGGAIVDIKQK
jgi:hypothetical protein